MFHPGGEVRDRPAVGHRHVPTPGQRLDEDEEVGRPVAGVLVVPLGRRPRGRRDRLGHVAPQLLARLVEADHRAGRVVRLGVELQHVLHAVDERAVYPLREAPRLLPPRLEVAFFKRGLKKVS